MDSIIENLGPQLVQFVKEYKYLLSFGLNISFKQSGHVARSGRINAVFIVELLLSLISNFVKFFVSEFTYLKSFIVEFTGLSLFNLVRNFSTPFSSPSASISTPAEELIIHPLIFNSCARR